MAGRMSPIAKDLYQYLWYQDSAKDLQNQANGIKARLLEHADLYGSKDDKGHMIFDVEDIVEVGDKTFLGFMKQRRVSQSFNEVRAEQLLMSLGIKEDDYLSTETFVDQEKVARLYAEDKLTDEQFKSLVDETITYAFVPVKAE